MENYLLSSPTQLSQPYDDGTNSLLFMDNYELSQNLSQPLDQHLQSLQQQLQVQLQAPTSATVESTSTIATNTTIPNIGK